MYECADSARRSCQDRTFSGLGGGLGAVPRIGGTSACRSGSQDVLSSPDNTLAAAGRLLALSARPAACPELGRCWDSRRRAVRRAMSGSRRGRIKPAKAVRARRERSQRTRTRHATSTLSAARAAPRSERQSRNSTRTRVTPVAWDGRSSSAPVRCLFGQGLPCLTRQSGPRAIGP